MCHSTTQLGHNSQSARLILLLAATLSVGIAQESGAVRAVPADWRPIGSTSFEVSLASLASGPVDRVWYSSDGRRLLARMGSGKVLETEDFESWAPSLESPPAADAALGVTVSPPESGARVHPASGRAEVVYALGRAVHRSEDGGLNWSNLSEYRGHSIIGDGLTDLAVSPRNENDVTVAGRFGLWRSVDGGRSWSGLNDTIPNFPVRRILGLPGDGRGTMVLAEGIGPLEWLPGERSAWHPAVSGELAAEIDLRLTLSALFSEPVFAVAAAGDFVYAGGADGRLKASPDGGLTWRPFVVDGAGSVSRIIVVPGSPRVALAAVGIGPANIHLLRTTNGGIFWDDLTGNLPDDGAHSVAADPATGAVYLATDAGVFMTIADLLGAAPATGWVPVTSRLTDGPVYDVRLDAAGNQIYVAVGGEGVFAATAPHRLLAPAVVNAADLRVRAASPGVLLSVLGGQVRTARAGDLEVPILAAAPGQSQIQIPFEVSGSSLSLALTTASAAGETRRLTLGLPLLEASPAIFIDRDGTPMVLDADSGVLLDAMNPARPGSRIQVLATGLGKVDPFWPTGLPAPLEDPPAVTTRVRIFLDRMALTATRATLAPGYVGFYLVEFEIPDILNAGPAELYLEAAGQLSNRTRIYLEP